MRALPVLIIVNLKISVNGSAFSKRYFDSIIKIKFLLPILFVKEKLIHKGFWKTPSVKNFVFQQIMKKDERFLFN